MANEERLKHSHAVAMAIAAAALYALSAPFSKLLLESLEPAFLAALLYLGAGLGMGVLSLFSHKTRGASERAQNPPLAREDLGAVVGMIILDIAAPILLMLGLSRTSAANAALLNNFEIVATSLIAMLVFKEVISRRLWLAITLVTVACVLLSFDDLGATLQFSLGSLFVLAASLCWGLENNLTRRLSKKDPIQVVVVKGLGSGLGSLLIALWLGEVNLVWGLMALAFLLGFVAYGLSIFFYVRAQRDLGAAKTSSFYAAAPFIGVLLALIVFRTPPSGLFLIALLIMLAGAYLAATDHPAGQGDEQA